MRKIVFAAVMLVCACRDHQPPAPTPEQNQQMNEADSMLNSLANEEGPEANASGPSNSSD
jgi:hypothetical protein